MTLDHGLHKHQAKPNAIVPRLAGYLDAMKAAEQICLIGRGDTDALIADTAHQIAA